MRRFSLLVTCAVVVLSVFSCARTEEMVFPGEEWSYWSTPGDAGFDESALPAIKGFLSDSMNTTGLVVTINGKILFDYGDIEEVSYLASVRKSVLAMLYGIYVEKGVVDLDLTLEDMDLNDIGGLTELEKSATVRDLISSRSGVFHPASNAGDDLAHAPERGSVEPGSYYLYSNWDFNAAGGVFELLTGVDIFDALEKHLAIPLQMQDFERERHRKSGNLRRSQFPAYHMHFSTRDMARIGHLMLAGGNWDGRQIMTEEWVGESVSLITPLQEMNPPHRREGNLGYGYMWWVYDGDGATGARRGAYTGRGALGQWITVVPKLNMVIAHKTTPDAEGTTDWPEYERLLDMIFGASTSLN